MKGQKWSEEIRRKMSISAKRSWSNPEIREKRIKNHFRGKLPSGKRVLVKCAKCEKEIEVLPYKGSRMFYKRYCSKECQKNKVKVECSICKKKIERPLNRTKNTKKFYCSNECKFKGLKKRIDILCEHCGKSFTGLTFKGKTPRFCSKTCSDKGKITGSYVYCKRCGKKFWEYKSNERTYCSLKCSQLSHRSTWFDEEGMMRKNYGKTWARAVKKRDNYSCQKCGSGKYVNAHHILDWKSHPNERYNVENGKTLCRECHLKEHRSHNN